MGHAVTVATALGVRAGGRARGLAAPRARGLCLSASSSAVESSGVATSVLPGVATAGRSPRVPSCIAQCPGAAPSPPAAGAARAKGHEGARASLRAATSAPVNGAGFKTGKEISVLPCFFPFLCVDEAEWGSRSDSYNAVRGSRSRRGLPETFCCDAKAASRAVGFVLQVALGWRWHKMGSLQWSRDSCEGAAVPGVGASRDALGCAAPLGPVLLQ